MKKMFFASALVMGLLSACSSDDAVTQGSAGTTIPKGLVPIELAMKNPVSIVTRGMGTVGGLATDVDNNLWRGEELYFNMYMKKDTEGNDVLVTTTWKNKNDLGDELDVANFDNEPINVFSSSESEDNTIANVSWTTPKYYPMEAGSRHDFFAYRIDDAASELGEDGKPVINDEMSVEGETLLQKSVNFVIDGSQDLMVGQANPNQTEDSYSAKSARAGVVPQINMEHLLTRFTFEVVAGDDTADGLEVREISVTSKTTGRMIMAWNPNQAPDTDGKLIWDEEVPEADLVLKQRPVSEDSLPKYNVALETMTPETLEWNDEPGAMQTTIPMGEALMVAPLQSEYTVNITTAQQVDGGETNIYVNKGKIRIMTEGTPSVAYPGTSYKVTVKLYGLSKIELTTKLTGWTIGEDIEVDTVE